MKLIRFVLSKIILLFDSAFSPTPVKRPADKQALIDGQTRELTLYQLVACPFCVKVRRQMKRLNLNIGLRDVGTDKKAHDELMNGGKQDQVPCLKISGSDGKVTWMYESSDINAYLEQRFGTSVIATQK